MRRILLILALAAVMVASMVVFSGGAVFAAQSGAGCHGLQNAYAHNDNEHVERDVAQQGHDCDFT
jgi:hypothetical protein